MDTKLVCHTKRGGFPIPTHHHCFLMAQGTFCYHIFLGYGLGCLARQAVLCGGMVLNVALHAQVPPSGGFVVGSAITMAGVRQALLDREGSSTARVSDDRPNIFPAVQIAHTKIFYPFNYVGLHERQWDLVIIEGWFLMINAFIHEVRHDCWWVYEVFSLPCLSTISSVHGEHNTTRHECWKSRSLLQEAKYILIARPDLPLASNQDNHELCFAGSTHCAIRK